MLPRSWIPSLLCNLRKDPSAAAFQLDYFSLCHAAGVFLPGRWNQHQLAFVRQSMTIEDVMGVVRYYGQNTDVLYVLLDRYRFRTLEDAIATCLLMVDARGENRMQQRDEKYRYENFLLLSHGLVAARTTNSDGSHYLPREQPLDLRFVHARELISDAQFTDELLKGPAGFLPRATICANIDRAWREVPEALDWSHLSCVAPIEYILSRQHLPWRWSTVSAFNFWLSAGDVERHPAAPWEWWAMAENSNLSLDWMRRHSRLAPFVPSWSLLEPTFLGRKFSTALGWIWQTGDTLRTLSFLRRHAAVGVLQRCWRRHRERLRRRTFLETMDGYRETYLACLPWDVHWMIYRYARPLTVLRGLSRSYW